MQITVCICAHSRFRVWQGKQGFRSVSRAQAAHRKALLCFQHDPFDPVFRYHGVGSKAHAHMGCSGTDSEHGDVELRRAAGVGGQDGKAAAAADAVAAGIDKAHEEVSILQYNDENSLSCTINLAFYFAREYYTLVRELPAGKGFADVCFIPRRLHQDKPAVVIELKWDKSASGALAQIKNKNYGDALKDYQGNLLLVGINYDKTTKKHECLIEKIQK